MIYDIVEQAILNRFNSKRPQTTDNTEKDVILNRPIEHSKTRVNVVLKRENKITAKLPMIVIKLDREETRDEEFMRGAELVRPINPQNRGPYDAKVSDLSHDVEHPDPINLYYEFLIYARSHREAKALFTDIKRLFRMKGFLEVEFEGNELHRLDMIRQEGPYPITEGAIILDSMDGNDNSIEVWGIKYLIEGYDDNYIDRKYEVRIQKYEFDYAINDQDIEPVTDEL